MTPVKYYLIKAFYQWITDNRLTPYIMVDATAEGVAVPEQYIQDGMIILNISPDATQGLDLGQRLIEFDARFGGIARHITVPVPAVMAIYARENGRGMEFNEDHNKGDDEGGGLPPTPAGSATPKRGKPVLKIVK